MLPTNDNQKPVEKTPADQQATKKNETPQTTPRQNRIFKESSPARKQMGSPSEKMFASQTTQYNSSRMRSPGQQPCTLYYREGGVTRTSIASFNSALSPQKLTLVKSTSILEYENSLLRKQLQQRDDVILMFKNGWSPNSTPLNDGIIKNLNLRLAQKNVAIEQVHRNLIEFEEIITKEKIQISPICMERFKILLDLVVQHEHYPIIVRERIIETSKNAQKVIIREDSNGYEWQIKMEKSYQELNTIKQKLQWFERQNGVLESTIAGLKAQNTGGVKEDSNVYKVQVQKLNNQVIMLQQEISNYKYQINTLTVNMEQLKNTQAVPTKNQEQLSRLRQQNKNLQALLNQKQAQITSLRDMINRQKDEVSRIVHQNVQLKATIAELRSKLENKNLEHTNKKFEQLNLSYQIRIGELDKELLLSMGKINQLEKKNKINVDEAAKWKKHCEDAESYIDKLLKEIQSLKIQFTKVNQKPVNDKLSAENDRLSVQITNLLSSLQRVKKQSESLRLQQNRFNQTIEQYKVQIKEYSLKIEAITRERDGQAAKWQTLLNQKNNQYANGLRELEIRIRRESEEAITSLRKQIDTFKIQINGLNSGKSTQIAKIRAEYEQNISKFKKQLDGYILQVNSYKNSKSSKDWQMQMQLLRQEYEKKQKQVWEKLTKAEQFIYKTQQTTKSQIYSLKSSLSQLQFQNQNLKKSQTKEDFFYKVDPKYAEIQKKLVALSSKSSESISKESQFWEQYRIQHKKDLQEIQSLINESLKVVGNVDQAIVVKRQELRRLDLTKLQEVLKEVDKIKEQKGQTNSGIRQSIETKFYGLLKTVSTPIPQ